ncbi:m-AAA protease-interacting protein 1, mitochondrial-like [Lineus longissimus]|uniref:m-AAA protease-interacting protein 1, mitochondrial-like n=1 Tax=Lineus longissimus TaxID=88925 RepID=UPI002B4F78E1
MAAPITQFSSQNLTNFIKNMHKCLFVQRSNLMYRNIRYFSKILSGCPHKTRSEFKTSQYLVDPSLNNFCSENVHQVRPVCTHITSAAESETSQCSLPCSALGGNVNFRKLLYANSCSNNLFLEYSRKLQSQNGAYRVSRNFHTSARYFRDNKTPQDPDDPDYEPPWREKPAALRLSGWPVIIWPSVLKTLKNWFLTFLIRGYMDESYSTKGFLDGAEQAVFVVSDLVAGGDFQNLRELDVVADEAIGDAQVHYADLNVSQRQIIKVDPEDIFFRYIYEIGMIFDDMTEKRFVEITTVFQGCVGLAEVRKRDPWAIQKYVAENADKLYICNYRFIREFTKGVADDWMVNKLNHFLPKEIVDETPPFSR